MGLKYTNKLYYSTKIRISKVQTKLNVQLHGIFMKGIRIYEKAR